MNKFFSDNKELLIYSSIIALFIPGIIVLFIYKGYLKNDIGISLIGYAGSVLGGFLTLFGVWWTINFTEETRKKDIFLQYRPFLSYSIENYKKQYRRVGEVVFLFRNAYFDDTDLYTDIHVINFKNAGKGDITSLKCTLGEIRVVTSDFFLGNEKGILESAFFLGNNYIDFLLSNDEIYVNLCIPKFRKEYINQIDFKLIILSINLDMEYSGAMTEEVFNQTLKLNLSIEYDEKTNNYITNVYNTSLNNTFNK